MSKVVTMTTPTLPYGTGSSLALSWSFDASARGVALLQDDVLEFRLPATVQDNTNTCTLSWDDTAIPTTASFGVADDGSYRGSLLITDGSGFWAQLPSSSQSAFARMTLSCWVLFPAIAVPATHLEPRILRGNSPITDTLGAFVFPPAAHVIAARPTLRHVPAIAGIPGQFQFDFTLATTAAAYFPLGDSSSVFVVMPDAAKWTFPSATPCTVTVGGALRPGVTATAVTDGSQSVRLVFPTPIAAETASTMHFVVACPNVVPPTSTTALARRNVEFGLYDPSNLSPMFSVIDAVRESLAASSMLGSTSFSLTLDKNTIPATTVTRFAVSAAPVGLAPAPSTAFTLVIQFPATFTVDAATCVLSAPFALTAPAAFSVSALLTNAVQAVLPASGWSVDSVLAAQCDVTLPSRFPTATDTVLAIYRSTDAGATQSLVVRRVATMPTLVTSYAAPTVTPTVSYDATAPVTAGTSSTIRVTTSLPAAVATAGNAITFTIPASESSSSVCSLTGCAAGGSSCNSVPTATATAGPFVFTAATQLATVTYSIQAALPAELRLVCSSLRVRTWGYIATDTVPLIVTNAGGEALWRVDIPVPAYSNGVITTETLTDPQTPRGGFRNRVALPIVSPSVYLDETVTLHIALPAPFDITTLSRGVVCQIDDSTRPVRALTSSTFLVQLYTKAQRALNSRIDVICDLILPVASTWTGSRTIGITAYRTPSSASWSTVTLDALVPVAATAGVEFPAYTASAAGDGSTARAYAIDLPYVGSPGAATLLFQPFLASLRGGGAETLQYDVPVGFRIPPNGGRCLFWYTNGATVSARIADRATVASYPSVTRQTVTVEPQGVDTYSINGTVTLSCDVVASQDGVASFADAGFMHEVRTSSLAAITLQYGSATPALTPAPLGFTAATPAAPLPATGQSGAIIELVSDPAAPAGSFTYGSRAASLRVALERVNADLDAGDIFQVELPHKSFVGVPADISVADLTCTIGGASVTPRTPFATAPLSPDDLEDDTVQVTSLTFALPAALRRLSSMELICHHDEFFSVSDELLVTSPGLILSASRASTYGEGLLAARTTDILLAQPIPPLGDAVLTVREVSTPGGPESLASVQVRVLGLSPTLTLPVGSSFVFELPGRWETAHSDAVATVCELQLEVSTPSLPMVSQFEVAESDTEPAVVMVSTAQHMFLPVGATTVTSTRLTVPVTAPIKTDSASDVYRLTCTNIVYPPRQAADDARTIEVRSASGYALLRTTTATYAGITGQRDTLFITHTFAASMSTALTAQQRTAVLAVYPKRITGATFTANLVSNTHAEATTTVAVALLMSGTTSRDALRTALTTQLVSIESDIAPALSVPFVSRVSTADRSYSEACFDGERSGNEADTDCGGDCFACSTGSNCFSNVDCASGFCSHRVCVDSNTSAAATITAGWSTLAAVSAALAVLLFSAV
jgi:hypothetical protein